MCSIRLAIHKSIATFLHFYVSHNKCNKVFKKWREYYIYFVDNSLLFPTVKEFLQDAQLSQRDRAAECVKVFAKSRRLEQGNDILRTL